MEKQWWKDEPLTICAIQANLNGQSKKALDEYVSKYAFNTEQYLHPCAKGQMTFYSPSDGPALDAYIQESKKFGIRQIVYYNIHCYDNSVSEKHPEWWLRKQDGEPIFAYNTFLYELYERGRGVV